MEQHPLAQFRFCPKCGSSRFDVRNFKAKQCGCCGFVYYFNPSAACVAVIVDPHGRLLVATRAHNPARGTLDLPGGFTDTNETVEEAVVREVKEETGLKVTSAEFLFSLPNLYPYSGFDVHTIDCFFLCRVEQIENLHAHDDVAALRWILFDDLRPEEFGLRSIREGIKKIQASPFKFQMRNPPEGIATNLNSKP